MSMYNNDEICYNKHVIMFRCEVSVEKSFYTLSSSKNVTVVGKDS